MVALPESEKNRFAGELVSSGDCRLWKPGNKCRPWFEWGGSRYSPARVSWYLSTGEWPSETVARLCKNRRCVRYEHLFMPRNAKSLDRQGSTGVMERFMARVQKNAEGCWMWTGPRNNKGYGMTSVVTGKSYLAHRAAWLLYKGDIPTGLQVCHTCDTPGCVNPDHLWLGTNQQNVADMVAKGRLGRKSKLVASQVHAIRRLAKKLTPADISELLNMTEASVVEIARGDRWVALEREVACSCC